MIIQTERLTLNHLAATDAPGIRPLFVDPQVMAHWDYEAIDAPALIAQLIENQLSAMAANQAFYWSLRRKGDTSVMGCFAIAEIDWHHRRARGRLRTGQTALGPRLCSRGHERHHRPHDRVRPEAFGRAPSRREHAQRSPVEAAAFPTGWPAARPYRTQWHAPRLQSLRPAAVSAALRLKTVSAVRVSVGRLNL